MNVFDTLFAAAKEHRLVIQRCVSCGTLRHPTGPMCGHCRSLDWDTVDACGRGIVYSFVVNHHPRLDADPELTLPAFRPVIREEN